MQEQRPFLASAFLAIAVSFGIGRYGIGLFLPDMARAFQLSDEDLGFMASAGWAGYVSASILSMLVIASVGARALVVSGLIVSALGMGLIAAARDPMMLYGGTVLTGISPGLVFAPLADAITARFEAERRGPAFAVVNSGEGAGAIAAGLVYLAASADWRTAWYVFCILASVASIAATGAIPGSSVGVESPPEGKSWWQALLVRQAWPLLCGSFVIGASTTVLWTYAGVLVDGMMLAGMELRVALWVVMGAAGVAAVVVAPILEALGLRRTYAASIVVTSASAVGLALAAGATSTVLIAGAVFGFAYIMVTSQIGAWAISIWPRMPAAGFGLTFLVFSAGAVVGPAVAGMATEVMSLPAILVVAGALTAGLLARLPDQL